MRKLLVLMATLAVPSVASALPICGGGADVTSYNAGGGCMAGNLILSNFSVVDAGNPDVELVNAVSSNVVGDTTYFTFNPNLALGGVNQDIHFFFKVTGLIDGVDLTNNGTGNTSISEQLCTNAWVNGSCSGSLIGTGLVADFFDNSDEMFFSPVSTAYVFKDIFKGNAVRGIVGRGHLTSFTQSFHTVPEPGSMTLLGMGFLGLASTVRRRFLRAR